MLGAVRSIVQSVREFHLLKSRDSILELPECCLSLRPSWMAGKCHIPICCFVKLVGARIGVRLAPWQPQCAGAAAKRSAGLAAATAPMHLCQQGLLDSKFKGLLSPCRCMTMQSDMQETGYKHHRQVISITARQLNAGCSALTFVILRSCQAVCICQNLMHSPSTSPSNTVDLPHFCRQLQCRSLRFFRASSIMQPDSNETAEK